MFGFSTEKGYSGIHQLEHLVAAFDALGVLLDAGFFEIHAGTVYESQEIFDVLPYHTLC